MLLAESGAPTSPVLAAKAGDRGALTQLRFGAPDTARLQPLLAAEQKQFRANRLQLHVRATVRRFIDIVRHIQHAAFKGCMAALRLCAVTEHVAAQARVAQAGAADRVATVRKHVIEEILMLHCPRCCATFLHFTVCHRRRRHRRLHQGAARLREVAGCHHTAGDAGA